MSTRKTVNPSKPLPPKKPLPQLPSRSKELIIPSSKTTEEEKIHEHPSSSLTVTPTPSPRLSPHVSPMPSPRLSPKVSPMPSPRLSPKVSPSLSPKGNNSQLSVCKQEDEKTTLPLPRTRTAAMGLKGERIICGKNINIQELPYYLYTLYLKLWERTFTLIIKLNLKIYI
jgi:hypothetical protein